MIKSPLRYPGGKSRAVHFLQEYIPPFSEFRDVFFGGGSLSFHMMQQHPSAVFSASDINYDLWCFWSQLSGEPAALIGGIQKLYDDHTDHDGKKLFALLSSRRKNALSPLQRAIDFYVLNRISFSGVVDSGGFSAAAFASRFTQSSIDRLWKLVPLIEKVDLHHQDYTELLRLPGDDVFIFLDPPYYSATKSKLYGKKGELHTGFDHHALLAALNHCPHRWMITYDNSPFIKEMYKGFSQLEWQLQYGMTNKPATQRNEILIANFELVVREQPGAAIKHPSKKLQNSVTPGG